MPSILLVQQSRTGGTAQLADSFAVGVDMANAELATPVDLARVAALDAGPADVLDADAIAIATPEHFGSMAGATKVFFEEIWHDCLDLTVGRPWQLLVKAGNDGSGTVESVQRLVTGLRWTEFRPPLLVAGDVDESHLEHAMELGGSLALSLDAGLV